MLLSPPANMAKPLPARRSSRGGRQNVSKKEIYISQVLPQCHPSVFCNKRKKDNLIYATKKSISLIGRCNHMVGYCYNPVTKLLVISHQNP